MSDSSILDKLNVASLPSPPNVAFQILRLARDPNAGLNEMGKVLELDPALSAQVLRICNSAAYRRGREITSVKQAVTVLGSKTVSIIALGFSLKESMPNCRHQAGLTDTDLWRQSVTTAVTARSLARLSRIAELDSAFLGGLLSRIGQLLLFSKLPDDYDRVLQLAGGKIPTDEQERSILGITHHQAGGLLLERWGLPRVFVDVVRYWGSDSPATSRKIRKIAFAVRISDVAAQMLFREDKASLLTSFYTRSEQCLGLSSGEVDRMFRASTEEISETLSVFDVRVDSMIDCESILEQARRQLVRVSLGLAADLTQAHNNTSTLQKQNEQLARASLSDGLTGLLNRSGLDKQLADMEAVRQAAAEPLPYSILMVDLDHFKQVNDTYGHTTGDEVLKRVGQCLTDTARATDFVARFGGEEFVVLLTNAGKMEAGSIAERFRSSIERTRIPLPDRELKVTASVGVASTDSLSTEASWQDVLEAADEALYAAKRSGRNRARTYEQLAAAY